MSIQSSKNNDLGETSVCGTDGSNFKCAIVAWVMPLIAMMILWLALSFPALKVLNIVVLAFGVTALFRSVAHIRQYGGCGLKGHVYVGATLNIIIIGLFILNVFFGIHYS